MLGLPLMLLKMDKADAEFMQEFWYQYRRYMCYVANTACDNPHDVDDIVSDALVKLSKHVDVMRSLEPQALKSYVASTLQRLAINRGEHAKLTAKYFVAVDEQTLQRVADRESTEQKVVLQDEIDRIRQEINQLPDKERNALVMKILMRMSDEEIARALGIAPVSVAQYVLRARMRLQRMHFMEERGE